MPFMAQRGSHATVFPGWTYSVWALDVEGERLVITAALGPEATPAEQAELLRMVETLEFVPAAPSDPSSIIAPSLQPSRLPRRASSRKEPPCPHV